MSLNFTLNSHITRQLEQQGPCTLDSLATTLDAIYSWNEIFMAVDVLSREGAITLRPHARFEYLVSLASASRSASQHPMQ